MTTTSTQLTAIVLNTGYGFNMAYQVQMTDKKVWLYQCRTQLMNECQMRKSVARKEGQGFNVVYIEDFYQRIPEAIS